jgi:hypothetical protein
MPISRVFFGIVIFLASQAKESDRKSRSLFATIKTSKRSSENDDKPEYRDFSKGSLMPDRTRDIVERRASNVVRTRRYRARLKEAQQLVARAAAILAKATRTAELAAKREAVGLPPIKTLNERAKECRQRAAEHQQARASVPSVIASRSPEEVRRQIEADSLLAGSVVTG